MFGKIISDPSTGAHGLIVGDNGDNYSFTTASWRNHPVGSAIGMRVQFEPRASHAASIRPAQTQTSATPSTSAGSRLSTPSVRAALQPSPTSKAPAANHPGGNSMAQHQGNASQGSLWAGIRTMSIIFLLTPLSIPLIFMLPLFGRLEILSVILLPGFFGGRRAGSFRNAIAAAILVSTVYALTVFLIFLAVLEFVTGLPIVGSHVEGGLDIVGGLGVTSGVIAALATAPFVLSLLVSSFLGALTTRR